MTEANLDGLTPELLDRIAVTARAISDKKGESVVAIDVSAVLAITDAFVITSAPNSRLVRTLVDEVEKQLKDNGYAGPKRIEGRDEASWVLMDFGDLVVHVFLSETRAF